MKAVKKKTNKIIKILWEEGTVAYKLGHNLNDYCNRFFYYHRTFLSLTLNFCQHFGKM